MKKLPRLVAGFVAGLLCDLWPAFVEQAIGLALCRESCPAHFRVGATAIYLAAPFTVAAIFLVCTSCKARAGGMAALMVLVGLVTLASHFYQTGFQA